MIQSVLKKSKLIYVIFIKVSHGNLSTHLNYKTFTLLYHKYKMMGILLFLNETKKREELTGKRPSKYDIGRIQLVFIVELQHDGEFNFYLYPTIIVFS